ncbi:MAG TPA: hypothetical protein VL309_03950 [Vicinamibacterales bacterium]|nr:hypothetical protein [Vicinamibacterales bacterium]
MIDPMLAVVLAAALAYQAAAAGGPPASDPAQTATDTAVSLERIRRALEQPAPALVLSERKPDFVVGIVERQRFETLIAPFLQFDAGGIRKPSFFAAQPQVGTTPALASIDLLAIASAVRRQLSSARRGRDAGAARSEVMGAIAEYCAAQPDGGKAIRMCMDPASIR